MKVLAVMLGLVLVACGASMPDLRGDNKDVYGCYTNRENPCFGAAGRVTGCCLKSFTCGGSPYSVGCPAGACCDIGDDTGAEFGAPRRDGSRRTPMRSRESEAAETVR